MEATLRHLETGCLVLMHSVVEGVKLTHIHPLTGVVSDFLVSSEDRMIKQINSLLQDCHNSDSFCCNAAANRSIIGG